jgi:hypothetical protein
MNLFNSFIPGIDPIFYNGLSDDHSFYGEGNFPSR